MKKFWFILLLLAGCLCAGCLQPQMAEAPAVPEPQPLPESSAAYLSWYHDIIPISLVQSGSQQLLNSEAQWYFEIQQQAGIAGDALEPPAGAAAYQTTDVYTGQTPFDEPPITGWLSNQLIWQDTSIMRQLYIQGDWQPFPVPVRYEAYTPDNQPSLPESWTAHFQDLLGAHAADTPLIIKNAYYFDIDGDGIEEAVVNAGNQVWGNLEPTAANLPANPECTDYVICCYFAGNGADSEALDISNMQTTFPNQPLSEAADIWYAYQPPTPEALANPEGQEQWYMQFMTSYQYNAAGELVLSPLFCMGEYDPGRETFILLADIDGDGLPELITVNSFIYAPIEVYKFTPGQALPSRQFGVNTPA